MQFDDGSIRWRYHDALDGEPFAPDHRRYVIATIGDWSATVELVQRDGLLEVGRLEIRGVGDDPPVTLRRLLREALRNGRAFAAAAGPMLKGLPYMPVEPPSSHPGRRGLPLAHDARIARVYVEELATGSRGVIGRTAQRMNSSEPYVGNRLTMARRRGLLTPTRKGQAGGELTALALAVLRADAEPQTLGVSEDTTGAFFEAGRRGAEQARWDFLSRSET